MTVAIPEALSVAEAGEASTTTTLEGKVVSSPRAQAAPSRPARPAGRQSSGSGRLNAAATGYAVGRNRSGRSSRSWSPSVGSKPRTGTIIAEFLIAMLFIWVKVFTATDTSYVDRMTGALWRSTACCGVFFILALVARGENTGKVAVMFGALVDLGVIFEATQKGTVKGITTALTGEGTQDPSLTADIQTTEPHVLDTADSTTAATTS